MAEIDKNLESNNRSRSFKRRRFAIRRAFAQHRTSLGPELVTNGDFASSVGWTLLSGASISGGTLNGNGVGDASAERTAAVTPLTTGTYRYSLTIVTTDNAADTLIILANTTVKTILAASAPGVYTGDIVVASVLSDTITVSIGVSTKTLDNFSLKKVL